jgi:UDP-N-acetylmuramoyl-tripeptide--D-alanyl-D-alanine ligase
MKEFFKSLVVRILVAEATVLLRRHKPTVVAVTGSVGKTSTKDAIYTAIKNDLYARKSQKSFNSDIGVPLTVLGLPNAWNNPFMWLRNIVDGFYTAFFSRKYPDVLILETGIDRPGDMKDLTRWLQPDLVVLTSLPAVPAHVEFFDSPAAVIEEKMRLVSAMKSDGKLIYNNDDTVIQTLLSDVLQQRIGYGRYLDTNFTARGDRVVYQDDQPVGVEFLLEYRSDKHKVFVADTIGTQHVYSCSAAIAVAVELGLPVESAVKAMQSVSTPPGRMRILPGIKGTVIIDDTYNSSPIASEHALRALGELKHAKRKIVVLGDMLELGKYSSSEHKRVGGLVPEVADVLFTVGVRARQIAEGALAKGLSDATVFQYDDLARAGRELQTFLASGDVVLVKASQGIRAERIVEEVMAEPERASKLLVRQDPMWRNID